jgi:hypothetical protein
MYVVNSIHHNAFLEVFFGHGVSMGFSRCLILCVANLGWMSSVSTTVYIVDSVFCEV